MSELETFHKPTEEQSEAEKAAEEDRRAAQEILEKLNNIELPEIQQLETPLQNILAKIKDKINIGNYTSIIGEDSSGRIPALILRKVINKVYAKKGFERIPLIFVAPHYDRFKHSFWETRAKKLKGKLGANLLVVTEWIENGEHLRYMHNAIIQLIDEKLWFNPDASKTYYDVVTIGVSSYFLQNMIDDKSFPHRNQLIDGGLRDAPLVWSGNQPSAWGQHIHIDDNILAGIRRDIRTATSISEKIPNINTAYIRLKNTARKDIQTLAQRLFQTCFSNNTK